MYETVPRREGPCLRSLLLRLAAIPSHSVCRWQCPVRWTGYPGTWTCIWLSSVAFLRRARTLDHTRSTLLHVQYPSHRSRQGLDNREQDEDTDVVPEHPEHEHCHQDLRFRTCCHLVYFLTNKKTTFSMRSRRRGASEEGGVMSFVKPKGSTNC